MGVKCCVDQKAQWDLEDVHWFYWFKQACLKDSYLLLKIDKLVDSMVGHEPMSFIDAFSSYHQIPLARKD